MPPISLHKEVLTAYLIFMAMRNIFTPFRNLEEACRQFDLDLQAITIILETRYLNGNRHPVPKAGNLHLAWEFAQNPADHHRFVSMLRVTPNIFHVILSLIEHHPVFVNHSNNEQTAVEKQLAVTLYRMGRSGNAAAVEEIARIAGCGEGSVENYTNRCFTAIEALHDLFIRKLTREEKEVEKEWVDENLGFQGLWREGYLMYDGTIVVLFRKPGLNGDAYYTRKGNYGLNVQVQIYTPSLHLFNTEINSLQIGNTPSNLRIADYSHGLTGSAHDAAAFQHTTAVKHPEILFEGEEFAWTDSAYAVNSRTIPVHKRPASLEPANALFDRVVSQLRVRSEHCMGALKGRFQSLRGLRVSIDSNLDHARALRWVTVAIILHNVIIDVEGNTFAAEFAADHGHQEELEDRGGRDEPQGGDEAQGIVKRHQLIAELIAHHAG
jgi:hypothetical protein